jgi:serine/threonine-protein kinase
MQSSGIGQRLGKYQILGEIGRGGMANVYKAFDPTLQRHVALKVLAPRLATDDQILRRFEREATTAANLKHPNIVVIHDVSGADGYHFLVMELLEGRTLREEIRVQGALPAARVANIIFQVASALDYAHQRGLIHRDVKPSNIILSSDDHATLTDFGLVRAAHGSRLTEAGSSLGTLEYMPPEQLAGDEVDWRSDIYSLGVVVFECLSGRVPFSADTPYAIMRQVMYEPPPPLSSLVWVNPAIEHVVEQSLAKSPAERFRSAGELAGVLYRALSGDELDLANAQGVAFRLRQGVMSVGRDPDNDLIVSDSQVSRHHAQIQYDGTFWNLLDLQSTNGTFVGEQRILPGQPRRLQIGDLVRFGPNATFQVVVHTAPASFGADTTMQMTRPV